MPILRDYTPQKKWIVKDTRKIYICHAHWSTESIDYKLITTAKILEVKLPHDQANISWINRRVRKKWPTYIMTYVYNGIKNFRINDILDQYAHYCISILTVCLSILTVCISLWTVRNRSLCTNIIIYAIILYEDQISRISSIMAPFVVSCLEVITIKYICLMWDFPERTESYTSMLLSKHLYFLQRTQNSVLFEHHFMTWLFCAGVEGPLQRRLQQLLLYMRCLQLLSQTLDYARTELKAKRLKPSTTVKNTLGKR